MTFYRRHRRPILLLEVLISFALVVLCILPLIYPNVFILKKERETISLVELDHVVSLLYAHVLQKLYHNEIAWQAIEGGQVFPIDTKMLEDSGYNDNDYFPFVGSFQFEEIKKKVPEESKTGDKSAWLFRLIFTFTPEGEEAALKQFKQNKIEVEPTTYEYQYEVAMEYRLP